MEPIRVCIGSDPRTVVAEKVLRSSIVRRTGRAVEFVSLTGPAWQVPPEYPPEEGFPLRRFMIPRYFGYQGRAIYLEADQLVLHDIHDLWTAPERLPSSAAVWLTYQPGKPEGEPSPDTSVMVIDCARAADWDPPNFWDWLHGGLIRYRDFLGAAWMDPAPQRLEDHWNHRYTHVPDETRLLHYTAESKQPWYSPKQPLSRLWETELVAALEAGAVVREDLERALASYRRTAGDHRARCGLHPYYARHLDRAAASQPANPTDSSAEVALAAARDEADFNRAALMTALQEIDALQLELASLKESWTYRIGHRMTTPLWALGQGIRSVVGREAPQAGAMNEEVA